MGYFDRDSLKAAQSHVYYLTENDAWQRFIRLALFSNTGDVRRKMFVYQWIIGSTLYVCTILLLFLWVRDHLDDRIRWIIFAPAALAMSGSIQYYWDFCLVYGLAGKMWRRTFHREEAGLITMTDQCARLAHRKRALLLVSIIAVAAFGLTLPVIFIH